MENLHYHSLDEYYQGGNKMDEAYGILDG